MTPKICDYPPNDARRASAGVIPLQRLKAWENALSSEYPNRNAACLRLRSGSAMYFIERSRRTSTNKSLNVRPASAKRRERVRSLTPSSMAIVASLALPDGRRSTIRRSTCRSKLGLCFARFARISSPYPFKISSRRSSAVLIDNMSVFWSRKTRSRSHRHAWGCILVSAYGFSQDLLAMLVADAAPLELRGAAFGLLNFAAGVAMLIASLLAGALWDRFGPGATFLAGAGIAAAALLVLLVVRGSFQKDLGILNRRISGFPCANPSGTVCGRFR